MDNKKPRKQRRQEARDSGLKFKPNYNGAPPSLKLDYNLSKKEEKLINSTFSQEYLKGKYGDDVIVIMDDGIEVSDNIKGNKFINWIYQKLFKRG